MCLTLAITVCLNAFQSPPATAPQGASPDDLQRLAAQLEDRRPDTLPAARILFDRCCKSAPDNASWRAFRQRFDAFRSLREEIARRLQSTGRAAINTLVADLWDGGSARTPSPGPATRSAGVPAEQLYRLYLSYFRYAIDTRALQPAERRFLQAYYGAEVLAAISEIMQLGRSLAAARDEQSAELEYCLLLLPLLHDPDHFRVESLRELPHRMLSSESLRRLSDFCLLRVGRLDAAEAISLHLKDAKPSPDSRLAFYKEASDRCVAAHLPGVAVDCLRTALTLVDTRDPRAVDLRFRVCDVWAGAKNWALAAGEAGQIARDFAGTPTGARAVHQRLKCLATQGDAQTLLHEIDDAIRDPACADRLPEFYHYKWKALRQVGQGQAASLVLKHFLEHYPQHPLAAEMYFVIARDCLSAQRYDEALTILESLRARYASSPYARQSGQLIERLYQLRGGSGSQPASRPETS